MTLARELVRRWRRPAALPEVVAASARLHLADAIGVGLAAAASPVGRPYRNYAGTMATGGPVTVFGLAAGAGAAEAALINGGLIHSLEYDDTHTASIAHGSAALAPAALAAAAAFGAGGAALLAAYARGWEALIRIGLAAPGSFQAAGFQVTSVGGAMVAAQIAADLAGLDEEGCLAAIGIALSQASGVFEFLSNGATVKSLHPGWAAHAGIVAAGLARAGLTGPETSFEGRFGLFRAFARDAAAADRFAAELADFGTRWHLPEAAFKFHPCCHYLHPFIEAAGLIAERGIGPGAIAAITCRVPAGAAGIICEPWDAKQAPASGHAARWSLPIAVAARLVEGRVDLATFEHDASPAVRALALRIDWQPLADARFPERFEAELDCRLADGSVHSVRVDDVYGNRTRPASEAAVRGKFRDNARRSLSDDGVSALEGAIDGIGGAADLGALTAALRGR